MPGIQKQTICFFADHKHLVAMGGEFCHITCHHNGTNPMELSCPGRPQLYFVDKMKQPGPFAVKPFLGWPGLFFFLLWCHVMVPSLR